MCSLHSYVKLLYNNWIASDLRCHDGDVITMIFRTIYQSQKFPVFFFNKCQCNINLPFLSFCIIGHQPMSPLTGLWAEINQKGRKMTGHTPPPAEITSWWREIPLREYSALLGFCVEKLLARHQQSDLRQTNYWPQSSMSVLQNHQTHDIADISWLIMTLPSVKLCILKACLSATKAIYQLTRFLITTILVRIILIWLVIIALAQVPEFSFIVLFLSWSHEIPKSDTNFLDMQWLPCRSGFNRKRFCIISMPIADMKEYQQYSKITNIVFIVLCKVLRLITPKLIQHDITLQCLHTTVMLSQNTSNLTLSSTAGSEENIKIIWSDP